MIKSTIPTPNKTKALIRKSALDKSKNMSRITHIPTNDRETYRKYFSLRRMPNISNPKDSNIQKKVKIPLSNVRNKNRPILKVAG